MKNKDIKPTEVVKLPELNIGGLWKKIIDVFSHIRHIYWISCIIFLLILVFSYMPHYIWTALWMGLKAQVILVSLVLVFCIVTVSLLWSVGQRIDVWVFMYFNMSGRHAPWLDWLMLLLTQMGNFVFAVVIALLLFLRGDHTLAYELIVGLLTLGLVIQIMKVLIHRTRPYIKLKNIRIVGSRASGRSFPSGHTGQAFYMATLLLHYFDVNISIWIVLYSISLFVGITRIYVGMHYPRDVIGGAMIGTTWGLLGVIVNSYLGL